MEQKLGLRFGAMCPSIEAQLIDQGFQYKKGEKNYFKMEEVKHFQKDADSIIRLRIRGLIPSSQADKSLKRLTKMVAEHVEEMNKSTKTNKK